MKSFALGLIPAVFLFLVSFFIFRDVSVFEQDISLAAEDYINIMKMISQEFKKLEETKRDKRFELLKTWFFPMF